MTSKNRSQNKNFTTLFVYRKIGLMKEIENAKVKIKSKTIKQIFRVGLYLK